MHTFEPHDSWEVETPHGSGIVLYVTIYGIHTNDIWAVANKEDGQIRHYQTVQLFLQRMLGSFLSCFLNLGLKARWKLIPSTLFYLSDSRLF